MSEITHHHASSMSEKFFDIEFTPKCNVSCINQISEFINMLKAYQILLKSIKINEDGTIPLFLLSDVYNYYIGNDNFVDNKNIQELFNVNILDLDFPFEKRSTGTPNNSEKK
ncbi:hypothetical protein ACTA71_006021 [Dictyostelium dimigraforme]